MSITLNGKPVVPTIFPDGTSQVWKLDLHEYCRVEWNFESDAEVFHMLQLLQLLDESDNVALISVYTPFLPYARQDHRVSNTSTFALRTLFKAVKPYREKLRWHAFDAHSGVAKEYIGGRFMSESAHSKVNEAIVASGADCICVPDAGAQDRYWRFSTTRECILFGKERDASGNVSVKIHTLDSVAQGKSILIIDDICDGGATFIAIAKRLAECDPKSIDLYVSHGIFSKGIGVLRDAGIERIFTKDGEVK